jgi:hypothetical protein
MSPTVSISQPWLCTLIPCRYTMSYTHIYMTMANVHASLHITCTCCIGGNTKRTRKHNVTHPSIQYHTYTCKQNQCYVHFLYICSNTFSFKILNSDLKKGKQVFFCSFEQLEVLVVQNYKLKLFLQSANFKF